MRINAKMGMFASAGLLILLTMLGIQWVENGHGQRTAASSGQAWKDINESDNGTWEAEYESDGAEAAGGVPAKALPTKTIVLPALLLIISGVFTIGTKMRRLKPTERTLDE